MALITFTLQDTETGTIELQARAHPFLPGPDSDAELTPAQTLAIIMISAAGEAMAQGNEVEEAELNEAASPTLFVVGDTGKEPDAE
jgi:hypothetical protein